MCGVWFELGAMTGRSPSCTNVNWYLIFMVADLRFYLTAFQLKKYFFLCFLVLFLLLYYSVLLKEACAQLHAYAMVQLLVVSSTVAYALLFRRPSLLFITIAIGIMPCSILSGCIFTLDSCGVSACSGSNSSNIFSLPDVTNNSTIFMAVLAHATCADCRLCGFSSNMPNDYRKPACSSTFAGSDCVQSVVSRCISLSECAPLGGVGLHILWCQLVYSVLNMDSTLPQMWFSLSSVTWSRAALIVDSRIVFSSRRRSMQFRPVDSFIQHRLVYWFVQSVLGVPSTFVC